MNRSPRVDYDAIAPLYDEQPYRAKTADPELTAFIGQRASAVLDIGCGTGNQLVANRTATPGARLVGVDGSLSMLQQARAKAADIFWVQADAASLPFADRDFDFISCQLAFHHFGDKAGALRAGFRVLRPGGRFVMRNLCPQQSPDWLYYEYFPEAQIVDLKDFWPPEAIVAVMEGAGFGPVTIAYEHVHFEQNLREWLAIVRRRDICSQLQVISDEAYRAGIRRLKKDVADAGQSPTRPDHLCLIAIRGDRP
jgi:ubiquinone/menaquinone biosynthesis C-methylase UbiE